MKAILIGLSFGIVISIPLEAQIYKGNTFIGGSTTTSIYTNVNESNASKTSVNSFSILPSVGFAVSSKIAVGIGLGYSYNYTDFQYYLDPINPNGKNHSSLYSIVPFFRYFIPISNSIFFSIHSEFSYGIGTATVGNYYAIPNSGVSVSANTDWSNISISSKPVFIFFPSSHWGIEAGIGSIGFNRSVYNPTNSEKQTVKNLVINAGSLSLGLSYYLKK